MESLSNSSLVVQSDYNWRSIKHKGCEIYFIGFTHSSANLLIERYLEKVGARDIIQSLYREHSFFAFILETKNEIFAAVDPTRSYPILYKYSQQRFKIGNFGLLSDYSEFSTNDFSVEMFLSAGYFLGNKTICTEITSMVAGNYLIYNNKELYLKEYYRYDPRLFTQNIKVIQDKDVHQEMDRVLNVSIKNTIEKADGKRIVLSLSAGLDSRLILSKLLEFKYDNIECISWGPIGNGDSTGAARIASKSGVRWRHIETDSRFCKSIFWSDIRKEFWKYSFSGVSIPNPQEFFVLCKLRDHGCYNPDNVLLVNGQSGDFNSGGHLPDIASLISCDQLIKDFIRKHFGLFPKLLDSKNFLNNVKLNLETDFGINSDAIENLIYALDVFEFYERQSKWVINGQRSADFFEYSWDLPLWHKDVVAFFEKLDYPQRLHQNCFKSYIKDYDPFNLFQVEIARPKWTGLSSSAIPVARLIGLLFGTKAKDFTYKYFAYYGINQDQFSAYELLYFLRRATSLRHCISLHTLTFLDEFSKFGISGLKNKKDRLI